MFRQYQATILNKIKVLWDRPITSKRGNHSKITGWNQELKVVTSLIKYMNQEVITPKITLQKHQMIGTMRKIIMQDNLIWTCRNKKTLRNVVSLSKTLNPCTVKGHYLSLPKPSINKNLHLHSNCSESIAKPSNHHQLTFPK